MSTPSQEREIDKEYLDENPECYFVFGDNTIRKGCGGAAILRFHKQAIGFITKILPTHDDRAYYRPENYEAVFGRELSKITARIIAEPDKTFLISRLGGGLANKYGIYEAIIKDGIRVLAKYPNVEFLWED